MAPRPRTTRREFLRGRSAAEALVDLAQGPSEPPASAAPVARVLEFARDAMACRFAVLLNAGQHPRGGDAALAALELLETLEAQLSIYRPHSEVCRLNASAAAGPVVVEAGLFELLALAIEISRQTGGAFDVTSGPLTRAWGFHQRAGRVPAEDERQAALARCGYSGLRLDAARRSVAFDRPGMEINLGGIGKGYALDRCGAVLRGDGVTDFLLHGGQSSVLAAGASGDRPDGGWCIGVGHPLRPERRLAEAILRDRALGTSGAAFQSFFHQGRRLGHVLDPRTGWPAEGVLSATVLAPTAAEADALSTALYVLGPEAGRDYLAHRPDVGAAWVLPGGRAGEVELVTANLAEEEWKVLEGEDEIRNSKSEIPNKF